MKFEDFNPMRSGLKYCKAAEGGLRSLLLLQWRVFFFFFNEKVVDGMRT